MDVYCILQLTLLYTCGWLLLFLYVDMRCVGKSCGSSRLGVFYISLGYHGDCYEVDYESGHTFLPFISCEEAQDNV